MTSPATVTHLTIIAGGKGTRLAGVLGDQPKVLVSVGGKTVLQHQLELAAASGISDVTIFAGYLAGRITEFVGDGSLFGLAVRVVVEDQPSGTAGALLRSLDLLPEHFFVLYGDVMLAVDLQGMATHHLDQDADFTAMAHPNDHPSDSDLLETDEDDWVTVLHACPHPPNQFFANLVNAALYVVRREALRPWAKSVGGKDFAKDIMPALLASSGRVLAHRSSEYIKDMGTPTRLERVAADWKAGRIGIGHSDSRPAVFLDRDGTLNVEKGGLHSPEELELIAGAATALRSLREAGFLLVVLTNQPVIARGEASEAEVATIHRRLEWELGKQGAYLDAIYICPHHPDSGFPGERPELKFRCECRKPGTGLVERACRELQIDPAASWMIGDQTRDIEMARRGGLRSILVHTGMAGRDGKFPCAPNHAVGDLAGAAEIVLQHNNEIAVL
jgi:D,D-heptose 1,7-bisphosphate phosphatase